MHPVYLNDSSLLETDECDPRCTGANLVWHPAERWCLQHYFGAMRRGTVPALSSPRHPPETAADTWWQARLPFPPTFQGGGAVLSFSFRSICRLVQSPGDVLYIDGDHLIIKLGDLGGSGACSCFKPIATRYRFHAGAGSNLRPSLSRMHESVRWWGDWRRRMDRLQLHIAAAVSGFSNRPRRHVCDQSILRSCSPPPAVSTGLLTLTPYQNP